MYQMQGGHAKFDYYLRFFGFLRKVQVQRSLDIHSIRAVAMQVLVLESGIKTSRNR